MEGGGCCTNPWAKARVQKKKLDRSWKCPITVFKSIMAVLARSLSVLHGINVSNIQTSTYNKQKTVPINQYTPILDSKTCAHYAIKCVINCEALGKGKEKGKCKNH